jgi:hypothetical protein
MKTFRGPASVSSILNGSFLSTEIARVLAIHLGKHHVGRWASELLSHESDSLV